jgi:hypothetical protein
VFFRIAFVSETATREWAELIREKVMTDTDAYKEFFDFVKHNVALKFGELVSLSDAVLDSVLGVAVHALVRVSGDPWPSELLLNAVNYHEHRRVVEFGLEVIQVASQGLHLNWSGADVLLETIVDFLIVHDWSKEVLAQVRKRFTDAIEDFLALLKEGLHVGNVGHIGRMLLNEEVLTRMSSVFRKSTNWQSLGFDSVRFQPAARPRIRTIRGGGSGARKLLSTSQSAHALQSSGRPRQQTPFARSAGSEKVEKLNFVRSRSHLLQREMR